MHIFGIIAGVRGLEAGIILKVRVDLIKLIWNAKENGFQKSQNSSTMTVLFQIDFNVQ